LSAEFIQEGTMTAAMRLGLVGLFVMDMERMIDFYGRVLGFAVTDRSPNITFLSRSPADHHQVVLVSGRPSGLPDRIVNQVSFNVGSLAEVQRLHRRVRAAEADEIRPICHGNAWSVYFRDPEGNRVEMFTDTDWYVTQPCAVPLDLDRPEAEIRRETEAFCRGQPGFKPIEVWRAEVARKIAEHTAGETAPAE
jgi:catechol-2,3-dioxygenase